MTHEEHDKDMIESIEMWLRENELQYVKKELAWLEELRSRLIKESISKPISEEQVCPEYCIRSHCIGCSRNNHDIWSNEPIKAKVKATGEVVEGFTDGQGHFDVFTDHNIFTRYDVNAVEFDTLESEKTMNQDELEKELDRYLHGEFQQTAGGNFNNYIQVARHFAEWGAEHLKK